MPPAIHTTKSGEATQPLVRWGGAVGAHTPSEVEVGESPDNRHLHDATIPCLCLLAARLTVPGFGGGC